jgi:predicted permease
VRAIPGVAAAGAVTNLPLASSLGDINMRIEGRTIGQDELSPRLDWQAITPGYFYAIGMRIVEGRVFTDADDERATGAVILNEAAARLHFPDEEAIGKRFELGGNAGPGMVTVIGIVGDIRHAGLDVEPRGEMYLAHRQFTFWNGGSAPNTMQLVARTTVPPAAIVNALRAAVSNLDPDLPAGAITTMADVEAASVAQPRFLLVLIGLFAAVALLLAAIGLYGLIAFMVGQRAHEIGVRMALGARTGQVVGMVLRQGMAMIGVGLVAGLIAALVLTRTLQGFLFGVRPSDPLTLGAVTLVLAAVGALACVLPARRAAGVAPLDALRIE